jgi:hypothetical protein
MFAKKFKALVNGGAAAAGVDGLQDAIRSIEAEQVEFRRELGEIPTRRAEAILADDHDVALDALEARERVLYRAIEKGNLQIAELQVKLADQRNLARRGRIEHHRKAFAAAADILAKKVEAAIVANEAAIACFEAAGRELGEQDASALFARIHFGGLLTRESLDTWHRSVLAPAAPIAVVVPQSVRAARPAEPTGRVYLQDWAPLKPRKEVKKRERPALPAKVPEGFSRMQVARPNYEAPSGELLTIGDLVDLPADIARIAAGNCAVDYLSADPRLSAAEDDADDLSKSKRTQP